MTASPSPRNLSQVVRSRGIGTWVGTLIGLGWMAFGLLHLPTLFRALVGVIGLAFALYLLNRSRKMIAGSRNLPEPDAAALAANRRVWRWFWLNFVAEIVLLNIAVRLLSKPQHHLYWIPAISFVVGLHFLPMAKFFDVPSYWFCGGAMIGVSMLVALALGSPMLSAQVVIGLEAVINAFILWLTAAWGIYTTEKLAEARP